MRSQNIDTVHTVDILSMYTSYLLLCVVIFISFKPAYHCNLIVCIPRKQFKKYRKVSNGLSFVHLRLHIFKHFQHSREWGSLLINFLLLVPICLMIALLVYINKNDTLLLIKDYVVNSGPEKAYLECNRLVFSTNVLNKHLFTKGL
jgi:hypothetical protein